MLLREERSKGHVPILGFPPSSGDSVCDPPRLRGWLKLSGATPESCRTGRGGQQADTWPRGRQVGWEGTGSCRSCRASNMPCRWVSTGPKPGSGSTARARVTGNGVRATAAPSALAGLGQGEQKAGATCRGDLRKN